MMSRPPAGAPSSKQSVIKRYANRRLYNSLTGQYVSRKSLEEMAIQGEEFVVEDTTTGEDITHAVLGQIIVSQEGSANGAAASNRVYVLSADFLLAC